MVHWYSAGIRIMTSIGTHFGDAVPIAEQQYAQLFMDFTKAQLDELMKYPTGRGLITEIGNSGNRLTIIAARKKGSQTSPEVDNATTLLNRFPKSFRDPTFLMSGDSSALANKRDWLKKNPGTTKSWQLNQSASYYSRELGLVIRKSAYTVESLAPRLSRKTTPVELQSMIDGTLAIDDHTHQELQLLLYHWLTPGAGINTCITFDAAPTSFCQEAAAADWEGNTVPFVVLGHEMVHAWRMMTGRRIFLGGVGEEHMTTGLPPYSGMKFSENKLRAESGLAIRDYYSANPTIDELKMVSNVSTPYMRRQDGMKQFWSKKLGK